MIKRPISTIERNPAAAFSAEKSVTKFLNVDLDLKGSRGLEKLVEYLGPSIDVLHQSPPITVIEWAHARAGVSLERTVLGLARLIKSLPPKQAAIWKNCTFRRFNIGIQGGSEPHSAEFTLSAEAVSLLAEIRAEVWITVYALDKGRTAVGAKPRAGKPKAARKSGLAKRRKPSK